MKLYHPKTVGLAIVFIYTDSGCKKRKLHKEYSNKLRLMSKKTNSDKPTDINWVKNFREKEKSGAVEFYNKMAKEFLPEFLERIEEVDGKILKEELKIWRDKHAEIARKSR